MKSILRTVGTAATTALLATSVILTASCSRQPAETAQAGPDHDKVVVYKPDYPDYTSVKQLFDRAALVVEARVTGESRVDRMYPSVPAADVNDPKLNPQAGAPAGAQPPAADEAVVITVHTVEIVTVYKGKVTGGQKIEVKELGGVLDGITYRDDELTPLKAAKTYALFLSTYPDSPASLINPQQAKYVADAAGGFAAVPGNQLTLTRTDLEKLAVKS